MKKGLKKCIALAMTFVTLLSTGVVSSAVKTKYVGTSIVYTNRECAKRLAEKLDGRPWDYMPKDIKIDGAWCASFTKVLYGWEKDSMFNYVTYTTEHGGEFIKDKTVEPEIGDLAVYDEGDEPDDYEHIGLIIAKKFSKRTGTWWVRTIEGNSLNPDWKAVCGKPAPEVDQWDYYNYSDSISYKTRSVIKYRYDDVRQSQIVGWLKPRTTYTNYRIGDVNDDGHIDVSDLSLIQIAVNNRNDNNKVLQKSFCDKFGLAEFHFRCDMTKDGEVNWKDVEALQQYLRRM